MGTTDDFRRTVPIVVGRGKLRNTVDYELGNLAISLEGKSWMEVRDRGLLGPLLREFDDNATIMRQAMGWSDSGHYHSAVAASRSYYDALPDEPLVETVRDDAAKQPTLSSDLAHKIKSYLHKLPRHASVDELSDEFDRSRKTVLSVLDEIRNAGYPVEVDDDAGSVNLPSIPTAPRIGALPGWGENVIRFCAISDTHCENKCCAWDELHAVYDRCVEEGITDIIHAGNLSDGPGDRGFKGHYQEVHSGCYKAYDCLEYLHREYPQRDGVTTHYISSSTCHEGWEFKSSGLDMGWALANGCTYCTYGRENDEWVSIDPRPDMHYLGMDAFTITCGPERNTRIRVMHPGGGSAYAVSYKSQKWVESLQGGTKPHLGIIGHFHKSNYFRPRDVSVLQPGCLCWQTGFMQKHNLAAEVAAWFVEMYVDAGGSVRRIKLEEMPFYFEPTRYYYLTAGSAVG